jgi:hypothetical protein
VALSDRWTPPPWLRAWWTSTARPVPFVVAIVWILAARRSPDVDFVAPNPEAAVAEAMTARGLSCAAGDVTWVDRPQGVAGAVAGSARALVRASAPGEPSDLYIVQTRLSPEGTVLDVGDSFNVTRTTGVDESVPAVRGMLAAYTTSADGLVTGVHVLDLAGAGAAGDFTRLQRVQLALTSLQQTGQTAGVAHDTFALDPVARNVALAWQTDGALQVLADDHAIVVDTRGTRVLQGESFVRVVPDERARPGNVITWAVDRVRAMSWFGSDRMQWVKAVAFTVADRWRASFSHGTTAQDVQDELGLVAPSSATPVFTDPEMGWPPAPIKLAVTPALPGEGQWIPLDSDPFITPTATGSAPAFVTSFVRPDVHRADVRVYVTLWDPRQVALHMEAGTVEPISANGEHGPGLVPRTPEGIGRLVAAFNGGFQAEHGEYGMQANGIEYLPPKPYAATVVELRDGSNGFGVWPDSPAVPDDVVAFRQNLTALVQDDKFNPWGRNWWGGTPPGWPDQVHSARSALCLTKDNLVGYFYSASISAEDLALGMLLARCSFGIHLDMNPGHVGFEFYDVAPEGRLAPMRRPLQADWEAEGKVSGMPGWVFRSRRMIRGMGHMLFPRYVQREARDFFYLTARPLLPGAPISALAPGPGAGVPRAAEPGEGVWRTKGLPQHGFPSAIATTWVRVEAGVKVRVVRADPRTMSPAGAPDAPDAADAPELLALAPGSHGTQSLWWSSGAFSIATEVPTPDATQLAGGFPAGAPQAAAARAAAGVQDADGMLVWVELFPEERADERTATAMDSLLQRLGCSTRIAFAGGARAFLGGSLDASGDAAATAPPAAVRFRRIPGPRAYPIFTDTPFVPIQVWRPLQAKRVRYFYKPAPAPSASASASSTPSPSASSTSSPQPPSPATNSEHSSIRVQSRP